MHRPSLGFVGSLARLKRLISRSCGVRGRVARAAVNTPELSQNPSYPQYVVEKNRNMVDKRAGCNKLAIPL